MSFNLKASKFIAKTYTKESGSSGQNWSFRYRAEASKEDKALFYFSNSLWEELNLDNMGGVQRDSYDKNGKVESVGIVILDHERCTIKKPRMIKDVPQKKTRYFSSDVLETSLATAGVIDPSIKESQHMKLEFVCFVEDGTARDLEQAEEGDSLYQIVADDSVEEAVEVPTEEVVEEVEE